MLFSFSFMGIQNFAQTDSTKKESGQIVETTKYDGQLKAVLTDGFLLKTSNFHYYMVDEKSNLSINATNPEIIITKNGKKLFLTIQGVDKSFKCHREYDVIDNAIDGAFMGWNGSTVFKLRDGQQWQQDEPGIKVANLYRPNVLIYRTNDGYKIKIDGIDELLLVKKIK